MVDMRCPNCGTVNPGWVDACSCGHQFKEKSSQSSSPSKPVQVFAIPPQVIQTTKIVDFDMPFGSMVMFMIKWSLAAIPAFIILFLILLCVVVATGGVFGGLHAALGGINY